MFLAAELPVRADRPERAGLNAAGLKADEPPDIILASSSW